MVNVYLDKLLNISRGYRDIGISSDKDRVIYEDVVGEASEAMEAIVNGEGVVRVQEELGDLLQSVLYWCMVKGFEVGETMRLTCEKFGRRLTILKKLVAEAGYDSLVGLPSSRVDEIWERVKLLESGA